MIILAGVLVGIGGAYHRALQGGKRVGEMGCLSVQKRVLW